MSSSVGASAAPTTIAEISDDGSLLFTGAEDGSGTLWDAADGRVLHRLVGHTARIFGADFAGDGSLVATAAEDGTARIWDVATGEELLTLAGHTDWVESVAWSPDGDPTPRSPARVVSGSGPAYAFRDGMVYEVRWNIPAPDSVLYLTNPDGTPFPYKPGNTPFRYNVRRKQGC